MNRQEIKEMVYVFVCVMRWLDGITDSMDMSLSKLVCCLPWGRKESDTTELNRTEISKYNIYENL